MSSRTQRGEQLWSALSSYVGAVTPPGVDVVEAHLEARSGSGDLYNLMNTQVHEAAVAEACSRLARSGVDSVVVPCILDPGVESARSASKVPIVGCAEASLTVARALGDRHAFVAVSPRVVRQLERLLKQRGEEAWGIHRDPVRSLSGWSYDALLDGMTGASDLLLESFEEQALGCVADGADVVIAGCAYLGALLTVRGYRHVGGTGVPVVDSMGAAIYEAAMLGYVHRILEIGPSQGAYSPYLRHSSDLDGSDSTRDLGVMQSGARQ